jgi:hypothetical protein
VDEYGWQPQFKKVTPHQRALFTDIIHGQYDAALAGSQLARQTIQGLVDLLTLCRAEAIPVALVLMPEASFFRACYSPGLSRSLRGLLMDIQSQWHVPLIDARAWIADQYFLDGHHLLPAGAAKFTARFGREALRPLLRTARTGPGQPRLPAKS